MHLDHPCAITHFAPMTGDNFRVRPSHIDRDFHRRDHAQKTAPIELIDDRIHVSAKHVT